ncbi:MAG: YiaA/YiaB family inner membrane protein [Bacteroidota bacterium]
METAKLHSHSSSWNFLVWAGFILSFGATAVGLIAAPLMIWVKAFLGMGITFITVSCFSLAKTLRDQHEQRKLINRVNEAKTEKLLNEVREVQ